MKTIRALGLVAVLAFGSAVGAPAQERPADVTKEADVAKEVRHPADVTKEADVAKEVRHPADEDREGRRDIGRASSGNWGLLGLLGLAGLAGLSGRYRDGANRGGTSYTRDRP